MEYKTFIDESGHTGDAPLNNEQKFFILSAVSIPLNKIDECTNVLKACFNAAKESQEAEIKATTWHKSHKKRQAMQTILHNLVFTGAKFASVIIEKRYMISGLIVDNFMDGAYNDTEDYTWCNNPDEQKLAAQYFYNTLNEENIGIVFNALRSPNYDSFKNALDVIVSSTKNERYKRILNGTYNHLAELCEDDANAIKNAEKGAFISPNYTSFATLGNMVAKQCRRDSASTKILFDHCNQFDTAYEHIFQIFKNAKIPYELEHITRFISWENYINEFNIANSKSEPLLQTADILATSSLKTLSKVFNGNYDKWNEYDNFILKLISNMHTTKNFWFVMSEKYINSMIDSFKRLDLN